MEADLLRVADSVVDELNTAPLSIAVSAKRLYQPQFELREMQTLHVTVVPSAEEIKTLTRGASMKSLFVDVGVQKKFSKGDAAELDLLVSLVDEIAALFHRKRLATAPEAICTVVKPDPIFAPEHMEQFRQFTSIVSLEFKVFG